MNNETTRLDYSRYFSNKSATLFLILVLFGDFAYILLHFIILLTPDFVNYQYSLEMDRGFAEMYQYLKWLWIIIIFIYISAQKREYSYLSWAAVFIYFFLDDAMKIHEQAGEFFASIWQDDYTPLLGLRLEDFGELVSSAIAGIVLLTFLALAYIKAAESFRKISKDILLLIFILIFFGVGIDMVHVAAMGWDWKVTFLLGVFEDGGEMIAASLIVWYTFLLSIRKNDTELYIFEILPGIFSKKNPV